jgi:hypothetical protein
MRFTLLLADRLHRRPVNRIAFAQLRLYPIARTFLISIGPLLSVACGGGSGAPSGSGQNPTAVAPTITTQPQNISVVAGQPAAFTVAATGTAPLSYQWSVGGTIIGGATSASYTIGQTTMQQSGGKYAVILSNSAGTTTSADAALMVNSSSTATTTVATSSIITATAPTVGLSNVATVDFTGQPALVGQTVSLAQVIDTDLNTLAADRQIDLGVDLGDANAIQIAVPAPPTGSVSVSVHAAAAISRTTSSQVPTVYVYSTAGDSGDGEDTFTAVPATIDAAANTITVSIPGGYFQPVSPGTYVAILKIGLAAAATSPAPQPAQFVGMLGATTAQSAVGAASSGLTIPCPILAGCTERSRFNPDRYLKGVFRPHQGVDFVAPLPTNIFVPSGGKPFHAFTQAQYNSYVAAHGLTCPPLGSSSMGSSACASINGRAGILLAIDYGSYQIRLLHLSALDASLLNPDGSLNTMATTSASIPVAQTGNTGAAILSGPHLHYEIHAGVVPVCQSGGSCTNVRGNKDPFPFIGSLLTFKEAANQTVLSTGAAYSFILSATDVGGVTSVSSAVQNAAENGGSPPSFGDSVDYDPTRKVCLSPSNANVLQFPTPDQITTFNGIVFLGASSRSYCAPWGTAVSVSGLANSPTTTVTAKYSSDATVSVSQDPLADASKSWDLNAGTAPFAKINSLTCTNISNPGVDLIQWSGSAGGPVGTSVNPNTNLGYFITATCGAWTQHAGIDCIESAGQPATTTFTGQEQGGAPSGFVFDLQILDSQSVIMAEQTVACP